MICKRTPQKRKIISLLSEKIAEASLSWRRLLAAALRLPSSGVPTPPASCLSYICWRKRHCMLFLRAHQLLQRTIHISWSFLATSCFLRSLLMLAARSLRPLWRVAACRSSMMPRLTSTGPCQACDRAHSVQAALKTPSVHTKLGGSAKPFLPQLPP